MLDFTQTCQETPKVWVKIHLYPEVQYDFQWSSPHVTKFCL